MADINFSTNTGPFKLFYTNSADPGGPAQHYMQGTIAVTGSSSATEWNLNIAWGFGMYIVGNGSGSSFYAQGQPIATSSLDSGLVSSSNYEWAFGFTLYFNNALISGPIWSRAQHALGEGAQGWGSATFSLTTQQTGIIPCRCEIDIIDSPNHIHLERSQSINFDIELPDLDYRPGQIIQNGVFQSLNRNLGRCNIAMGNSFTEMRTQDGGLSTSNPPFIYINEFVNQSKLGAE